MEIFFIFYFLLQVAEYGEERRVVGVVRGCVKTVTRGKSMYVKVAYILGLRVCPAHRSHSLSRFPESLCAQLPCLATVIIHQKEWTTDVKFTWG